MRKFDILYNQLINEADMNRRDFLRKLGKGVAAATGSSIAPKGLVGAAIKGVLGAATGNVNIPGAAQFKSLLYPVLGMIKTVSGPTGVSWVQNPTNLLKLFNAASKLDKKVMDYSAYETGYSDFIKVVLANDSDFIKAVLADNMEEDYGEGLSAFEIEDSEVPSIIQQKKGDGKYLAFILGNFIHHGGIDEDGMLGSSIDMVQSYSRFPEGATKISYTTMQPALFVIAQNFLVDPKNGFIDKEIIDELMRVNLDIRHELHSLADDAINIGSEDEIENIKKGIKSTEKYMNEKYGKNPEYEEEKQRFEKNREKDRRNIEEYDLIQSMKYSRFDTAGSSEDEGYAKYYESRKIKRKIIT